MNSNGEKQCHYLAVKNLSTFLKGTTLKNKGGFSCLNCLHSFRTKKELKSHKKACEKKDFFTVNMPSDDTKITEFNQNQKSDKAPFIIYADLECVIEKTDGCKNNPENLSARKGREHISSGFSMFTKSLFRSIENEHNVYITKGCMKKFCEFLRDHALKIINSKKKNEAINKRVSGTI